MGGHIIKKDGYVYDVIKLDYLSFTSNFNVADEEDKLVLIIWPQITGGFEYGLLISDNYDERHSIYVDEKGQVLDQTDLNAVQVVEEFSDEVENLFVKANEMWSLDK